MYVSIKMQSSRNTAIYLVAMVENRILEAVWLPVHAGPESDILFRIPPPLSIAVASPDLLRRLGAPGEVVEQVAAMHVPEKLEATVYACGSTETYQAYGRVLAAPICRDELYQALVLGSTIGGPSPGPNPL